jgi:hypothetical protein
MIAVVYLCFAPYGPEMVKRFADSYRKHPAGLEHELVIAFHGFTSEKSTAGAASLFDGFAKTSLMTDPNLWDLGVYRQAVDETDHETYLFLNSHSELLADDWLAKLFSALAWSAMVGCTGSCESGYMCPFPNPHLRSNAFMAFRGLIEKLDWPRVRDRESAWHLECGPLSLSRQARATGELRVVGSDGTFYEESHWRDSKTFRSEEQENLLVADNRTRHYAEADAGTRAILRALAWDGLELKIA